MLDQFLESSSRVLEFIAGDFHFLHHGEEDVGQWRVFVLVVSKVMAVLESKTTSSCKEEREVLR